MNLNKHAATRSVLAAMTAAMISLPCSAIAGDSSDATKAAAPSTVAKKDVEFFEKAAQSGMAEVQAGELAAKRAMGEDIRAFGQKMASDHRAANDALKSLATRKGVVLPTQLDKDHLEIIDDLQKADAKKFDETYAKAQEEAHKDAVALFTKVAKNSRDPDIRNYASDTLPTLQDHSAKAKGLADKKS